MKSIKFLLLALMLSVFAYGQEEIQLENIYIEGPTTFLNGDGRRFVGDTLFLNGNRINIERNAVVRFEIIIGPGDIFLYPESRILVSEIPKDDVRVWVPKIEEKEKNNTQLQQGKI